MAWGGFDRAMEASAVLGRGRQSLGGFGRAWGDATEEAADSGSLWQGWGREMRLPCNSIALQVIVVVGPDTLEHNHRDFELLEDSVSITKL